MRGRPHWRASFVDVMPDGYGHAVGLCDREAREILVLATVPKNEIAAIVAHEIHHACCAHRTNPTDEESAEEERSALLVERALLPIMASLGAKLPPFPEGFDAFRRAVRKR